MKVSTFEKILKDALPMWDVEAIVTSDDRVVIQMRHSFERTKLLYGSDSPVLELRNALNELGGVIHHHTNQDLRTKVEHLTKQVEELKKYKTFYEMR